MKKKEIKLSLVYRDMWQASGKYVPRKDQLEKVAPHIIEMGCFARVRRCLGAGKPPLWRKPKPFGEGFL